MAEHALKLEFSATRELKKIKDQIIETHTEELIIGLCAPIGSDVHFVSDQLVEVLEEQFNYQCQVIRLSNFIKEIAQLKELNFDSEADYVNQLIHEGNKLRENKGSSVLAELAINEISINRELNKQEGSEDKFTSKRVCYIIDSIKNSEELELFRLIYSSLFYFVGVFSNIETRQSNLESRGMKKEEVFKLMDKDSGEEIQFGQQVSDSFTQADFFLRIDSSNSQEVKQKIGRYLNLIFASEVVTPSENEMAMYQAFAAAGNSACLSRQVGASILSKNGEIVAVGWNDVPKFNGGVYTFSEKDPVSKNDHRCINRNGGKCFNDHEKELIRHTLIDALLKENLITSSDKQKVDKVIQSSRIKELVEFSRAVHAEMLALISGGQKGGDLIKGGKLFCTTYPCHNCARHIVAAGIKEVYYIEPYRKSLAIKLHADSICEDVANSNKLKILMFDGVSPRRYLEFFKMTSPRKKAGIRIKPDKKTAYPKNTVSLQAIPILEKKILKELENKQLITIK